MTVLTGRAKAQFVHDLFARIAARYDLMNRIISLGQDQGWRRETVRLAQPRPGGRAIDVAAGTGGLAIELARRSGPVAAVDFCLDMLQVGRRTLAHQPDAERIRF